MIEVASYFSKDDLGTVFGSLQELPEEIRPVYFSDSESLANSKNLISDKKRFEKFVEKNPDGFFLLGNDCLYDLKLFSGGYSQIYLDLPEKFQVHLNPLFNAILKFSPDFAYATDCEERKHRNRCYKTIGVNHIEDWVGRDISKYVPGLYCYTLLSKRLIEKHGVDISELESSALSCEDLGGKGMFYLLKFYDDTTAWKSEAEKLDELCYQAKGVFSIREVLKAAEGIDNLLDYDDVIYEWR